jgi:hypothetical protein
VGERGKTELTLVGGLGCVPLKWVSMIVLLNSLAEMRFVFNVFLSLPILSSHIFPLYALYPMLISLVFLFLGPLQSFTNFVTTI